MKKEHIKIPITEIKKEYKVCKQQKLLSDFYFRNDSKKYREDCKKCYSDGRKVYRKEN